MIDLAGSENSKTAGVNDERLQECNSINKSLSALQLVFKGIQNGDGHIPYRNSKLTQILQNYLHSQDRSFAQIAIESQARMIMTSCIALKKTNGIAKLFAPS